VACYLQVTIAKMFACVCKQGIKIYSCVTGVYKGLLSFSEIKYISFEGAEAAGVQCKVFK